MMETFASKMGQWGEWAKQNPEMLQAKIAHCTEWAKQNPDKLQEKMQGCGGKWKDFGGNKNGWKEARAVCVRKPE